MDPITHVAGAEGAGDSQLDLQDRARVVEDKVKRDAREIVEVLRLDFPRFFERQARERYVASSFQLGADAMRAVKADLKAAGERAVQELLPALEDESLWIATDATIPPADRRKDLASNPKIHGVIQRVGQHLREVLQRHRFPDLDKESFDNVYRLPTWFIGGRLLIGLVESYWRNLEELRSLQGALGELEDSEKRQARGSQWDEA